MMSDKMDQCSSDTDKIFCLGSGIFSEARSDSHCHTQAAETAYNDSCEGIKTKELEHELCETNQESDHCESASPHDDFVSQLSRGSNEAADDEFSSSNSSVVFDTQVEPNGFVNVSDCGKCETVRPDAINDSRLQVSDLTMTKLENSICQRNEFGCNEFDIKSKVELDANGDSPTVKEGLRNRKRQQSETGDATKESSVYEVEFEEKVREILDVLDTCHDSVASGDVRERVKELAISRGGLVNNDVRSRAWPVLLGVDVSDIPPKPDADTLRSHKYYEQVVLDVNRSLKRFPPGMDDDVRLSLQDQLVDCIMRVLNARPHLHYYQGYHDIVVTFLLVVGEDATFALMNELSVNHLRDFMYESMEKTTKMLHYLYPLLGKQHPALRQFMQQAEVGTIFSLPWLITWFGHVLGDLRDIVRLYDFFIACHPLMPIYLAAAIVLYRGDEILASEPDMPIIHCLLSRIPSDLPIEHLVREAGDLFLLYPPDSIRPEAQQLHQSYLDDIEEKRLRLQQVRDRAAKSRAQQQKRAWRSSALVKVTVWTGVAVVSAVAFNYVTSFYMKGDALDGSSLFDMLWRS